MWEVLQEIVGWLLRLWIGLPPETKTTVKETAAEGMDKVFRKYFHDANQKASGA